MNVAVDTGEAPLKARPRRLLQMLAARTKRCPMLGARLERVRKAQVVSTYTDRYCSDVIARVVFPALQHIHLRLFTPASNAGARFVQIVNHSPGASRETKLALEDGRPQEVRIRAERTVAFVMSWVVGRTQIVE